LLQEAGYEIHADCVVSAEQLGAVFAATAKHELVILRHQASPARRDLILKMLRDYSAELPCIVIGNEINADTVEFMKAGACDFVLKNELARIAAVVDAALKKLPRAATYDHLKNALRVSEEKYARVFRISPDAINLNRLTDGAYIDINDGFTRILGYTREEVLGRSARPGDLNIWINEKDRERLVSGLKGKGEFVGLEAPFRCKDGRVVYGLMSARIMQIEGVDHIISYTRDITERRRMEEEVRRLSQAVEQSPASIVITDLTGTIEYVNGGFTRTTGYSAEEVRGRKTNILKSGAMPPSNYEELWRTISAGGEWHGEFHNRRKNGELYWEDATISALKDSSGHATHFLAVKEDISARKQSEHEREETIRLLRLCNQHDDTRELVHALTLFFQELSGCEAVGVRLRDGSDFPYFETRGFSGEFKQSEGRISACDAAGVPSPDEGENPILDCMCGNILCGHHDPTKSFFTQHGSYWINCSTEPLTSSTETGRLDRTCHRCNSEGFESITLIPLRHQTHTLGLLQLSDRRKGLFTAEKIAFFEGLAEYTTIALTKLESDRARRASEERLRALFETSEAGYFFIDPEGIFRNVNPAWLRMHGYDQAEEIIGQHFRITLFEPEIEKGNKIITALLAGEKVQTDEFARRNKDGSTGYHTHSIHVVRKEGRAVGIEGFLIDTTGLHQAHEEFRILFEQMLDGFALHEMIFDAEKNPVDYRFLTVNPAFERITGLKATDIVGQTVFAVMPEVEHKWIERYGEVVRTGEPQRFEDYSAALEKHFEVVVFRPQEGQFACLVRDVSERKQLELQLLQSQKMEAIGQLAGGIAHDFNNILAAIMMHLGLLQHRPGLMPEMKASLKELETEAKRAASLTRQLLLFSRRQSMRMCTTDLNDLLSNLLKMLRRLIGEHIKLVFGSGYEPLWIEADSGMIEQVIVNLCVNARDAMPDGGVLKIEAYAMTLAATETLGDTQSRAGQFVCLAASDNGCGMNADTLKHIYEPFFTTKEAGKGTGLGLATVYSIVKQHHGWINVQSAPGEGTTFRVFLPAGAAPATVNGSVEPSSITGGSEGVLVVEDDIGFRTMLTMSLKILGYRVFEAANGKDAMRIWAEHSAEIGLLLADMVMPGGTNGLELCHRLALEKPALRMIITTGYSPDRVDTAELASEGISFLPKPFSAETLATAVRHCFDQA